MYCFLFLNYFFLKWIFVLPPPLDDGSPSFPYYIATADLRIYIYVFKAAKAFTFEYEF